MDENETPAAPAAQAPDRVHLVLTTDARGHGSTGRIVRAEQGFAAELVELEHARAATAEEVDRAFPIRNLER